MEDERTYCEECYRNLDDNEFDCRFDRPVCVECAEHHLDEITED